MAFIFAVDGIPGELGARVGLKRPDDLSRVEFGGGAPGAGLDPNEQEGMASEGSLRAIRVAISERDYVLGERGSATSSPEREFELPLKLFGLACPESGVD